MTRAARRRIILLAGLLAVSGGVLCWPFPGWFRAAAGGRNPEAGAPLDEWRGVSVRSNGADYAASHGRHYSTDAKRYYYGQKWQCVEYVKRFYYDALHHVMPDVMGHAKDFFDPATPQGALNTRRGLLQFRNDGTERPLPDDLVVFTYGGYGHVAIITSVEGESVEVIQQNVGTLTRERLTLSTRTDGTHHLAGRHAPAGWLRLPGGPARQDFSQRR